MDVLLIIIPIAVGLCTIATFFITRSHDSHKKGKESGALATDVDYIKKRIDDVYEVQKRTNETLVDHAVQIGVLTESMKTAHKRIDLLENKIKPCRQPKGE